MQKLDEILRLGKALAVLSNSSFRLTGKALELNMEVVLTVALYGSQKVVANIIFEKGGERINPYSDIQELILRQVATKLATKISEQCNKIADDNLD